LTWINNRFHARWRWNTIAKEPPNLQLPPMITEDDSIKIQQFPVRKQKKPNVKGPSKQTKTLVHTQ
jgi:hypothetical protein